MLNLKKVQEEKFSKEKQNEEIKWKERNNITHTSKKSAEMLEKAEKSKLNEIFQSMDSDKDGFISSNKIDISSMILNNS